MFNNKTGTLSIVLILLVLLNYSLYADNILTIDNTAQDPYFHKIVYRNYRTGAINAKGEAYQNFKAKTFKIWHQQICWDAIVTGVGKNNESDIKAGINSIEYSFGRMKPDGSFADSTEAGSIRFLLALGKSYYEVENSRFEKEYLPRLDALSSKIKKAAFYVLNSSKWKKELELIEDYCNQMIGTGLMFKLMGTIIKDKKLIDYGHNLFYKGIEKQTKQGVFPEKGGYDSSYQAVSLMFIQFHYYYLAGENEKRSLLKIMEKGWEWELGRIKNSGEIIVKGNTRTGLKQEKWRGKFKDVNYPEVSMSLLYWAHIKNDQKLRELANRVFKYAVKKKK
ncbi:MAG: hypothetical protein JW827_11430 [Spirochaetes bacterium]|nr:hypothetical protein [Spirochaetota bacterium]